MKGRDRDLPAAGELLAVEAIDQTGLIVTSEGAFVRIFRVTPPNPLLMSAPEREKTAATFQRLISQLKADETLQIYIDARPVNLTDCSPTAGARWRRAPGRCRPWRSPQAARRRSRNGGCTRRWRSRCACTPTSRPQCRCPATSWCRSCRGRASRERRSRGPSATRLPSAPLQRPVQAHRRAVREQLAHVDALRSELEADGMATELLDGEQVAAAVVGAV